MSEIYWGKGEQASPPHPPDELKPETVVVVGDSGSQAHRRLCFRSYVLQSWEALDCGPAIQK